MRDGKLPSVVLAALLHDIGKLLERGNVLDEARTDETYLECCPTAAKGNYKSHLHSAYTRAFCDWLEQRFDCLRLAADRSWKDWCASHHRSDETGIEFSVVRQADRLSSSEREEGDYYSRNIHLRTLLEPIVERVFLARNQNGLATGFRYPLEPLTSRKKECFPVPGAELGLKAMPRAEDGVADPASWSHMVSQEPMVEEYKRLCEGLLTELEALSEKRPDLDIESLIVTLMSLLERYTANVPSATNVRHPDISLFDHLRTTAAIAQALYLHKTEGGDRSASGEWLLVCGDFSGIQKFIYNLTNRGAAKGLRGRSFYVQLFCRLYADYILKGLGLSRAALLYNSGGKFYILLPAHLRERVYDLRRDINRSLIAEYGAAVYLGIGMAEVTVGMFEQGRMHSAWKDAAEDLERDRTGKFKELLSAEFFEPQTDYDPTKSCNVCGSRSTGGEERCGSCKRLEKLGSWLKDAEAFLTHWGSEDEAKAIAQKIRAYDPVPFSGLKAHVLLVPGKSISLLGSIGNEIQGECVFLNKRGDESFKDQPVPGCGVSTMYLGKWESGRQVNENGEPWDFEDYAEEATGIKRLGILRMDVDNLGEILIRGLRFARRESVRVNGSEKEGWGKVVKQKSGEPERKPMASLSRMATLSRQLNHFFSGYMPRLLDGDRFNRCQIIYAGGDDLFVIGSWDQLPDLAYTIRNEFREFCCFNPDFSISGGMILQGGKYPIYKGAQQAGQAEKKAKELRREWKIAPHGIEKDAFC
ncbi:MAG: type III-A CRISPR-associated protein Cas10/Csm1, partial [Acidobacteriota bacterium]